MRFLHKDNNSDGAFYAEENSKIMGEILYTWINDNVFAITHTEVLPAYRGGGVAKGLVDQCADFAREGNYKIVPICQYAQEVMVGNPAYADVVVNV